MSTMESEAMASLIKLTSMNPNGNLNLRVSIFLGRTIKDSQQTPT